jgi:hypothetical protein
VIPPLPVVVVVGVGGGDGGGDGSVSEEIVLSSVVDSLDVDFISFDCFDERGDESNLIDLCFLNLDLSLKDFLDEKDEYEGDNE